MGNPNRFPIVKPQVLGTRHLLGAGSSGVHEELGPDDVKDHDEGLELGIGRRNPLRRTEQAHDTLKRPLKVN